MRSPENLRAALTRGARLLPLLWLLGQDLHALSLSQLTAPEQWALLEYRLDGVPSALNPFDPEAVSLQATFVLPSGRQMLVPAFRYRAYTRVLQNGTEKLSPSGEAEWRLRFTPPEPGAYTLNVQLRLNGQTQGAPVTNGFTAAAAVDPVPIPKRGYARIAGNGRYFETDQGQPLPLIGACVCWHGARGTYDYDDWFESMRAAGENYARLWMCPWAFGLEADADSRTNYHLDRAWQLDYVLRLAERKGIYLLLCLDYHGMFATQPDYWGGNNYWPKNPYNTTQGGPCATPNAFFADPNARKIYEKRLRYLVARYGYSPNLLAWEFLNEIDNEYADLTPADVASWHGVMGDWLRANDPYHHLVTTSLTGSSDRSDIWTLPQMDFAAYHSYGQPQPAATLPGIVQSFVTRYKKPMMIGEIGTDWRGWARDKDPYLRGWRQGLWAGALGGSVGTSMSWFWENLHSENAYPAYRALTDFTVRTRWGRGRWEPAVFPTADPTPTKVGDPIPGGQPFTATLSLNAQWGPKLGGQLALTSPLSASLAGSALNSFVHGTSHSDLRIPFRIEAWLGTNAILTLHVNSVSAQAVMAVLRDGVEIYRKSLPNKDGGYDVNNEYNQDFIVTLPPGKHLIEVKNAGGDWFYLDWVKLENVLPSEYAGGWKPAPVALGMQAEGEALLYVVNPQANFPAGATNATIEPLRNGTVTLKNLPAGRYAAFWYQAATAEKAGETVGVSDGTQLVLPLPEFSEDLAGHILRARDFGLQSPYSPNPALFQAQIVGETGHSYVIEASGDLEGWQPQTTLSNIVEATTFTNAIPPHSERQFFRARLGE